MNSTHRSNHSPARAPTTQRVSVGIQRYRPPKEPPSSDEDLLTVTFEYAPNRLVVRWSRPLAAIDARRDYLPDHVEAEAMARRVAQHAEAQRKLDVGASPVHEA